MARANVIVMKGNHVISIPGKNKYLRSSLYVTKAITSMVKLFPRRTQYDDIFYKTHKIMNMFKRRPITADFIITSKFYWKDWPLGPRLLQFPIARYSGVMSSHSLSVCIYACLTLFHVAVATVRAFVQRIPTNIYHEDSETRRKGGPGTQWLVVQHIYV